MHGFIFGCVTFLWRNAQRRADFVQRILAVRVELDQPRRKVIAPLLQVDAAGDTAVADGVSRARIGVASIGNGLDGSAEVALARLFAERVAPLERTFAGFQHPCRRKRRLFRLRANVVQHHEQHILDVAGLGGWLAVYEAVNDERACVDIPCLAFFHAGLFWQERRERSPWRAVRVIHQVAITVVLRLLPHNKGCLAHIVRRQASYVFYEFRAILTHRLLLICRIVP